MWSNSAPWLSARDEGFAKGVWFHQAWTAHSITSIDWSGITAAEQDANKKWCDNFARAAEVREEDYKEKNRLNPGWEKQEMMRVPQMLAEKRKVCRGGCGEKDSKLVCSRCKITGEWHYYLGKILLIAMGYRLLQ